MGYGEKRPEGGRKAALAFTNDNVYSVYFPKGEIDRILSPRKPEATRTEYSHLERTDMNFPGNCLSRAAAIFT
jgi:hypothetical protein